MKAQWRSEPGCFIPRSVLFKVLNLVSSASQQRTGGGGDQRGFSKEVMSELVVRQ